jgi:FkbM family methyltransferase
MTLRRLRRILRHVLPNKVKDNLRPKLFGYTKSTARRDWSFKTDGSHVSVEFDGIRALFPETARTMLTYHCFENGDSIEELSGFVKHAKLGPGTLLDVGAANGLFSVLYALAHPGNRVIAYEPSNELCDHFQAIVGLNDLSERISITNTAVGRTAGFHGGCLTSAGMLILDQNATETSHIRMVRLDDELEQLAPPLTLKIDVEGYEGEVLWGARQLLEKHHPTLFLEFHLDLLEKQCVVASDLLRLLGELDYGFYSSSNSSLSAKQISSSPKAIIRFIAR